ncbi:unnamed protein product [Peniophora sp. CBMAI 1063]|nr:unnamed protein product [Peniophora sp. CBMAI 1063]
MEGFSAHVKGSLWVICRGSSTQRKVRLLRIAAHRLLCARRDRDREVADAQVPLNGVALVCVIMMHISKPATCFATARFLPRRSQRGSGSLPALIERAEGPIPFAVSRFALSTLSAEDSVATERCAENSDISSVHALTKPRVDLGCGIVDDEPKFCSTQGAKISDVPMEPGNVCANTQ